jgi:WD40 repeat protein
MRAYCLSLFMGLVCMSACDGGSAKKGPSMTGSGGGGGSDAATAGSNGSAGSAGGGGQAGFGIEGEKAYDESGSSLDLSSDGTRVVIGSRLNDGAGTTAGHVRVFERSGDTWVQLGADLDGEAADDRFGTRVAISANGSRIAAGADLNDGGGVASGSARVYDYVGGVWTQVGATIYGVANDAIGWSLDLSADGKRLVVGGSTPNALPGRARVYELVAGAWTQVGATLEDTFSFGSAACISADGNRIAVSQIAAATSTRPGTVYVYDWNGTSWAMVGSPLVGRTGGFLFGTALSFSADGNTIAIGARQAAGYTRVYRLTGGAWEQVGADLDGVEGENLGNSVSVSADGTRLLAGGPPKSTVRYYKLSAGAWVETAIPNFVADTRAGEAVAISADGTTAAVGATYFRGADGAATGIVRIYALP